MSATHACILVPGLALALLVGSCAPYSFAGSGSAADPFLVETAAQLDSISRSGCNDDKTVLCDKHFRLMADIDLADFAQTTCHGIGYCDTDGLGGEPQGQNASANPFTGLFNGNGFVIKNLRCHDDSGYDNGFTWIRPVADSFALFECVGPAGVVENVRLEQVDISFEFGPAAPLVARLGGRVSNCSAGGVVRGSASVGGLVSISGGTIENSASSVDVSGDGPVGGLVGSARDAIYGITRGGTIRASRATGSVDGVASVGGLAGYNSGLIEDSSAGGLVEGSEQVGGLVGVQQGSYFAVVNRCSASGDVRANSDGAGGLVGANDGAILQSFAAGRVASSGSRVGGLVGESLDGHAAIVGCYARGAVSGRDDVGGLVGLNAGLIERSYSSCEVEASGENAGGLVGRFTCSRIGAAFSVGDVAGVSATSGVIGRFVGRDDPNDADCLTYGEARLEYASCYFWQQSGIAVSGGGQARDDTVLEGVQGIAGLDASYFFDLANAPMDVWNAWETAWCAVGTDLPGLCWEERFQ